MTVLERELQVALDVVERCGAIALDIQAGGDERLQTSDKADDQGPVTQADLAVEAAILEALRGAFPDDAILAEESAQSSTWRERERVWLIDPVDGTKDFANGDTSWAIHVGLLIGGHPALGVVLEPGHGRLSWAIDHGGVRRAHSRSTSGAPEAEALHELGHELGSGDARWRLVTSKSHRSARLDAVMAKLGISSEQVLRTASTGVKISMVARGEAELYVHPTLGTKLWDSGPPQAILHAAGGRLTNMRGEALSYAGPGISNELGLLASARGVDHDAVVASLRPLVDEWFGSS